MRPLLSLLLVVAGFNSLADGPADNIPEKVRPVPPPGAKISDEVRTELLNGANQLGAEIEKLRGEMKGKSNALALLPDIQIFQKAVDWAVRYDEIFNPASEAAAARNLLKSGMERVQQLRDGRPQWISATGLVVRGYVSRLDGSVQPYGLVVPARYFWRKPQVSIWRKGQ